jgi:hypothetical protein
MGSQENDRVAERFDRLERALARILACVDRDELLTEREAAALRRKTVYALRKERARRAGPLWIKDGNAVRYRKSDLLAWLQANARDTRDSEREPRFGPAASDVMDHETR